MAKANYLSQIRKRLEDLRKEYGALTEALALLSSATGTRGRKPKVLSLDEVFTSVGAKSGKRTGKRGRPPGSKSRPGSKKPGPKPKENVENLSKKTIVKVAAKRGRKPGKSSSAKKTRSRVPDISAKIVEVVAKGNRFTTNAVITDKIASYYPGKDRSDLGKYISVILANMKARKELGVITKDSKGNKMRSGLWGLPGWFESGKPKADFLK